MYNAKYIFPAIVIRLWNCKAIIIGGNPIIIQGKCFMFYKILVPSTLPSYRRYRITTQTDVCIEGNNYYKPNWNKKMSLNYKKNKIGIKYRTRYKQNTNIKTFPLNKKLFRVFINFLLTPYSFTMHLSTVLIPLYCCMVIFVCTMFPHCPLLWACFADSNYRTRPTTIILITQWTCAVCAQCVVIRRMLITSQAQS